MAEYYCPKCKEKRYSSKCYVCGTILGGESDLQKFSEGEAGPGKGGVDRPNP